MWSKALLVFTVTAAAARPQQQQQLSDVVQQALSSNAVQSLLTNMQQLGQSFQSTDPFEGIQRLNSLAFDAAITSSPPVSRQSLQDSQDLVNRVLAAVGNFVRDISASTPSPVAEIQEISLGPTINSVNRLIQAVSAINGTSTIPVQIPAFPPIQIPGFPPIQIPTMPPIQIPVIQPAVSPAPTRNVNLPASQPIPPTAGASDSSGFPEEYQEP